MSLTDKWMNGELNGCFWCTYKDGHVEAHRLSNFKHYNPMGIEVIAPCDYEELQRLIEENKSLKGKCELYKNNNSKLYERKYQIEKQLMKKIENQAKAHRLQDQAFAKRNKKIKQMKNLLKESCNELKILKMLSLPIASQEALNECDVLLTRINAAIGDKEE